MFAITEVGGGMGMRVLADVESAGVTREDDAGGGGGVREVVGLVAKGTNCVLWDLGGSSVA